jgi:hypothetical protein
MAMSDPNLPGEPRVRARYGDLVVALGEPATEQESALLILLARYMNDQELDILIQMVNRRAAP